MTTGKLTNYWTLIIILLIAIITVGGTVARAKYSPSPPVAISIASTPELPGEIYIGGAISNPGFYPLKTADSLEDIIRAGGGITSDADASRLELYIPETGEEEPPQQINLNRAEAWLLEALPGIGKTRAQAIIDYREQNGLFNNINELTKVTGIGTTTYEEIKHLITVAD
jgi:competence protein ComEA